MRGSPASLALDDLPQSELVLLELKAPGPGVEL